MNTRNNFKRPSIESVQSKIDDLNSRIHYLSLTVTLDDSRKAQLDMVDALADISNPDFDRKAFERICDVAQLASMIDERDRYQDTIDLWLNHRLVEIEGNWVITTGKLISPAGFDRQSSVYVLPTVCLQFNSEAECRAVHEDVACGQPLYVYNMMELRGEC